MEQAIRSSAETKAGLSLAQAQDALVINCVFRDNYSGLGGGMCLAVIGEESPATVVNCTFHANRAIGGGAIGISTDRTWTSVTNSILWGDIRVEDPRTDEKDTEIFHRDAFVTVTHSIVAGGYPGAGNLDQDPQFFDAQRGDLRLSDGSPCVDAADGAAAPELDMAGNPRFDDPDSPNTGVGPPWVDMGAHEYQGDN